MKQRRIVVIAFMLVACLCIGVGFATLTDELIIKGSAEVTHTSVNHEFDLKVVFTDAQVDDGETGVDTATINGTDADVANLNIASLNALGDKVSATFTIKNDSSVDAVVTPALEYADTLSEQYFKITSDWNSQPQDLAKGGEITITLTVELIKLPDATTPVVNGLFNVRLTATGEAPTNP